MDGRLSLAILLLPLPSLTSLPFAPAGGCRGGFGAEVGAPDEDKPGDALPKSPLATCRGAAR